MEGRSVKDEVPNLKDFDQKLREEAHMDLADVQAAEAQGEPTSKTQIIAQHLSYLVSDFLELDFYTV